ncbi:tetraacyldisaccharide 4'-kinase [Methyloferula stellata]|uniref:tetraacyldisaccharide 4'-kinase n=1 Tax=Methyloferula stellata TaxID=876270 RepID=UPI00038085A9|nr:tetraacyldisaccharide 4'-kinase [Methyloferula stellata]
MARLLAPLGWAYGAVTVQRMSRGGARTGVPVFCVGNFVAGGAGKTPTAIAIAHRLQAQGEKPAFLSRGYGGKAGPGPVLVDAARHTAEDVGDEALLLARVAPTIVGADRVASAALAVKTGASVVILDDGLQNPSLAQDLRLAVVDGTAGIGNGLCIPAGPLRAPLSGQLASISAILIVGEGAATSNKAIRASKKPILTARFVAEEDMASQLAGKPVVAFAGIGLPEKFKATVLDVGATIAGWRSFPDHHVYSAEELRRLQSDAAQRLAALVTTEKDYVRIAPLLAALDPDLPRPLALPGALIFDDTQALDDLLTKALHDARAKIQAV